MLTVNALTSTTGITAPTFHGSLTMVLQINCYQSWKGSVRIMLQVQLPQVVLVIPQVTEIQILLLVLPTADGTTQATAALMGGYLIKGNYGVKQVLIDEGDYIKNKINIGPNTGFITERPLTTKEIRTKLKDPANNTNRRIYSIRLYAENRISEDYNKKIPTSINRSFDGNIHYTPYENTGSGTTNSCIN